MKISLLIVDDHTVVREGLRALLQSQPDMEILGEAGDGHQAVARAQESNPDVVLMDVAMPHMNGRDATRKILKLLPSVKVLVLSSYVEEECVAEMLSAGAAGFLPKQTVSSDLLNAIREVNSGRTVLSSKVSQKLIHESRAPQVRSRFKLAYELTSREIEVLRLIARGFSNKRAAEELGLSIKTIEKHRQTLMNKLNVHETAGLTRYAIRRGLVAPTAGGNGADCNGH